jgi:hypothetical protein
VAFGTRWVKKERVLMRRIPLFAIAIKIPKPKPTPTGQAEPTPSGEPQPSHPQLEDRETAKPAAPGRNAGEDQPTIAKDSIVLTTQKGREVGGYEKRGWVPEIEYSVNGPIASGSKLSVEFMLAGKPWVSFDCETNETERGHSWHVRCGGDDQHDAFQRYGESGLDSLFRS